MSKTTAIVFGIIFIIAGIWGFIQTPILGLFAADAVSSVIHIIVGIVLLMVASKPAVTGTLKTIGIVYVIFAILTLVSGTSVLRIFTSNASSGWLYFILGFVIAILAFSDKKSMVAMPQV